MPGRIRTSGVRSYEGSEFLQKQTYHSQVKPTTQVTQLTAFSRAAKSGIFLSLLPFLLAAAPVSAPATPSPLPSQVPVTISSLLNPAVYSRAVNDREVMTRASLEDAGPGLKKYSFYTVMLAHADIATTRRILTDYKLYAKMISYIDRASFNSETHILDLEGGIWKFRLSSRVRFEEKGDRWIHYQIVAGHFAGLSGELIFESMAEKGTLVLMTGSQLGDQWPPAFVIERGAEIVFGFTGKRMRSYIEHEDQKGPPQSPPLEDSHDQQLPQPRHRF